MSRPDALQPLDVLIVDDEPLARDLVRSVLGDLPALRVTGECAGGREAVEAIRTSTPDLVLLDVQMPEVDGFDVIEAVGAAAMPDVIFVTAHERYAVRAFEVNALDYLLKPFDAERFERALERARAHLAAPPEVRAALREQLLAALSKVRVPAHADRFLAKAGSRLVPVHTAEIDWIEAAGKYARLHCGAAVHLVREPFHRLESRLDPSRFARIHRSTIVNLDRIRSLEPNANGEYRVRLVDGTELVLSRSYRGRLGERFGKGL